MSVCEYCPLSNMLDAAAELARSTNLNGNKARTLGGIVLTRRCHEKIAEKTTCPEPFQSPQTGQLDCPLREATYGVRGLAFGPWNPAQFTVMLEKPLEKEPEHPPIINGQYL